MFPGLDTLTEVGFMVAEFRSDPDDGLDWP